MIARYSRPEMTNIWSEEERFKIWLSIETLALEGMAKEGLVPASAVQILRERGGFSVDRINELEGILRHDVLAFLTSVAEHAGPEVRSMHRGMTSSDLLDTATALQLVRSSTLIVDELDRLLEALRVRVLEFRSTPCIGRSHGIHAEPTTFGMKLAGWFAELVRCRVGLLAATERIAVGKISGPVGTYAGVSPAVEKHVLDALGLQPETVATQVVARDRHAAFLQSLALLATAIERAAVEIRHLQRTEVREVEEAFAVGQKGSSAMPHKRNPVLSENLSGLARLVRANSHAALENVALWHERDISHSSVERVVLPDSCTMVHFMVHRFTGLVRGLVVRADRMRENLELTRGVVFSGNLLLALTDHGMTRELAYQVVQEHALAAFDGGAPLLERVQNDARITGCLSGAEIAAAFDLTRQLRHVDQIIDRALGLPIASSAILSFSKGSALSQGSGVRKGKG